MKIKYLLFTAFVFAAVTASAQTKKKVHPAAIPAVAATSTELPRPKLLVGIVVDQMRCITCTAITPVTKAMVLNAC